MLIKHPQIDGLSREVPDEQAKEWIEAGWVQVQPEKPVKTGAKTPDGKDENGEQS